VEEKQHWRLLSLVKPAMRRKIQFPNESVPASFPQPTETQIWKS